MIFVTVGTTHFDELIREVDRLAGSGEIRDEVLAQIGRSAQYVPANIHWTRWVNDIRSCYAAANLVICHGGSGTVFDLLAMGKDFIPVANRALVDDHQNDLLHRLRAEGWCQCCLAVGELAAALRHRTQRRPYPRACALPREVWGFLVDPRPTQRAR